MRFNANAKRLDGAYAMRERKKDLVMEGGAKVYIHIYDQPGGKKRKQGSKEAPRVRARPMMNQKRKDTDLDSQATKKSLKGGNFNFLLSS